MYTPRSADRYGHGPSHAPVEVHLERAPPESAALADPDRRRPAAGRRCRRCRLPHLLPEGGRLHGPERRVPVTAGGSAPSAEEESRDLQVADLRLHAAAHALPPREHGAAGAQALALHEG